MSLAHHFLELLQFLIRSQSFLFFHTFPRFCTSLPQLHRFLLLPTPLLSNFLSLFHLLVHLPWPVFLRLVAGMEGREYARHLRPIKRTGDHAILPFVPVEFATQALLVIHFVAVSDH